MFQIFGWAELGIDLIEGDSDAELSALTGNVSKLAEELNLARAVDIRFEGGTSLMTAALVQNRDRGDSDRFLELLRRAAELGPASYGVFYRRDDETRDSLDRFVLRRGRVEVVSDDLFSPIVPMIEDPG